MPRPTALLIIPLALCVLMMAGGAWAADATPEIPLTVEKNQFQPGQVKVKAGTPFVLVITNKDSKAVEFESKELRVEKVVPAGKTVKVRVRALKPGAYPFFDDFNQQTSGRIVAE